MSEVKVNKVSPRSGTTVTIGDSGDTINIVGTLQNNGSPLAGDISSVVAGTGLSGGATSGVATLNIEAAQPTITSLGTITGFTSTGIDDNADATAITIDSSERVGILQTSPTSNLHVASGGNTKVRFEGNLNSNTSTFLLSHTASGDVGLQFNSNQLNMFSYGDIAFYPSTSNISGSYPNGEVMRIRNNGKVGIGTTSPDGKLQLVPTAVDTPIFSIRRQDHGSTNLFEFFQDSNMVGGTGGAHLTTNNRPFAISTDSSSTLGTGLLIDIYGKVGIGTSSPSQTLDVNGVISSSSELRLANAYTKVADADAQGGFAGGNNITVNTNSVQRSVSGSAYGIHYSPTSGLRFVAGGSDLAGTSVPEAMRINSSGNVGIGTSSPEVPLSVVGLDTQIQFGEVANAGGYLMSESAGQFRISGGAGFKVGGTGWIAKSTEAVIIGHDSGGDIKFYSNTGLTVGNSFTPSERMRIDSSGNVFISKTTDDFSVAGTMITNAGGIKQTVNSNVIQQLNRLGDDGGLIKFYQAGGEEGNISVSGATVSYNGFTGTHWSRFTDNSTPTILRGTVLESLDEMCDWYNLEFDVTTQDKDGNDVTTTEKVPHVLADGQSEGDIITYNYNGTDYQATIVKEKDIKHMMSKVSDTTDAKNVYGVFNSWDKDGEGYNDFFVASVGSFVVRIKQGETVAKGDLLQSNGDGTAKVQTDDAVRSSSFAKILSTTVIETYEDGSYLVPCSLMC